MKTLYKIKKTIQDTKYKKINIGNDSRINIGVKINLPSNVFIGNNTYINGGTLHCGKNSKIVIGNDCLLSYNIHLRTITHNYEKKDILIRNQGEIEKDIIIEDDCWIGYGVQILPGVTIHKGAVIGAGAIVTKDIPEYGIAVGVPAKVIKYRN